VAPARPSPPRGGKSRPLPAVRRPVAVDLFAGAGGFALGLEQAGFDVVTAVEYDPIHAAVHKFNFPMTEVLCTDASKLTGADLLAAVKRGVAKHGNAEAWDGKIDLVFGGPPCQGFSSGGKRDPKDERNLLVFDFARLVDELKPRYFAMENVPPLKNYMESKTIKLLDRFVLEMEASGYNVLDPEILNASRYGVPQDRRRLIVLGSRKKETAPKYPAASVRPVKKRAGDEPKAWQVGGRDADEKLPVGPAVSDAIGDVPDLDKFEALWLSDEVKLSAAQIKAMEKVASTYAKGLRSDNGHVGYRRTWNRALLTSSARTSHELKSIARFEKTKPGDSDETSRLYRLDPTGLCSTIRAGTGYERGSFMAPRPIHPTSPRVISPREAARLHSFPDWFRFHTTKWHAFRQIGNSLPPMLARAIGAEIVAALGVKPSKPTKAIALGDTALLAFGTREAAKHFEVEIDDVPSHKLRHRKRKGVEPAADARAA
jgi:DNA (cytosine-5)-methyltransferase 1